MSSSNLRETLVAYGVGLEAELQLLEELRTLSGKPAAAASGGQTSATRVQPLVEARGDLMKRLLALEETVRPVRQTLAEQREAAAGLPEFEHAVALHRRAERLITEIVEDTEQTVSALETANRGRRVVDKMVNSGRTTLSAYRRVAAPIPPHSSLIRRRG